MLQIPLYKLALLGDGGVGKTALTAQFCHNYFIELHDPTFEDSYRKRVLFGGQSIELEIVDTAGQEQYGSSRVLDQCIEHNEGFLLVYSITSRSSFNWIQTLHRRIKQVKKPIEKPASIVLVGNKTDSASEREVSVEEGRSLAMELGCSFLETSAKSFTDVERAFYEVLVQRFGKLEQRPSDQHQPISDTIKEYFLRFILKFGCF